MPFSSIETSTMHSLKALNNTDVSYGSVRVLRFVAVTGTIVSCVCVCDGGRRAHLSKSRESLNSIGPLCYSFNLY